MLLSDTQSARLTRLKSRVIRGLQRLWFWDVWHLQPSGPLSWRYVLPWQSAAVRLHRQLWWHSRYKLPGLLWLPLEFGRWVHWQMVAAQRRVRDTVSRFGPEVEARFGIETAEQARAIGYWARHWCIDPYAGYQWRLYRPGADGLRVIYDNETAAFHAMQNRKSGAVNADHRLLGDKIALAEMLADLGLPMVTTDTVSSGDWHHFTGALERHSALFCKLRSGNQGESAFSAWPGEKGPHGQALDGTDLPNELAVRKAWDVLTAKDQVLIQPLLMNHPNLAPASVSGAAIALRVVTRVSSKGPSVWWAELQVPCSATPDGNRGFWRVPVSVLDGTLSTMGREWFLRESWQNEYAVLWQQLNLVACLPHWAEVCKYSLSAHQAMPAVWAIAWDWVITPSGPMLLEGNGGWGLAEVQQSGASLVDLAMLEWLPK